MGYNSFHYKLNDKYISSNIARTSNIPKDIPDEVVEYIASNTASDVRAIEGAINRLAAYSVIMGGIDITLETAVDALKDMINKEHHLNAQARRSYQNHIHSGF